MSHGVPYISESHESHNTKYPGIPGMSNGVPYISESHESHNTKYPGIPGIAAELY